MNYRDLDHGELIRAGWATVAVALMIFLSSGCGRWSTAAYEERARGHIDSRLEAGLLEDAFMEQFPDAELWREEGDNRDYLVAVGRLCFICTSRPGFESSNDYFVRVIRFQDERLVSIEPVELNR